MEQKVAKSSDRQMTLLERVDELKDRLDKQTEEKDRIYARLRTLEDRVDSILGSELREADAPTRGYDRR